MHASWSATNHCSRLLCRSMLESKRTIQPPFSTAFPVLKKIGANDKLRQQTVGQNGSALPLQTWGEWELSSHGAIIPCFFIELYRYMFHGQGNLTKPSKSKNLLMHLQVKNAYMIKTYHRKLQSPSNRPRTNFRCVTVSEVFLRQGWHPADQACDVKLQDHGG